MAGTTGLTVLQNGSVGIGAINPSSKLDVRGRVSIATADPQAHGVTSLYLTHTQTTNWQERAMSTVLWANPAPGETWTWDTSGLEAIAVQNTSGTTTVVRAAAYEIGVGGNGTMGSAIALDVVGPWQWSVSNPIGTINNLYGLRVGPSSARAGANITIGNNYGIYIQSPTATAGNTINGNDYGIYQVTATQKNYFAGNVGMGTSSPVSDLHIENQTATTSVTISTKASAKGGRIILEDIDGAGCSEVTALNGVLTAKTITCPTGI